MRYRCVKCHKSFSLPAECAGSIMCERCSFPYQYEKNYLKYEFDSILFETYKRKYLLNKVLNNNAYLSYLFVQDESLSLSGRDDVNNFRSYIQSFVSSGVLLDIGCGILPMPGYLDFTDKSKYELYGLDPIDDKSFSGTRIVGCAEYTPFDDNQFDAVVFATSLDHVCSIERTIAECNRILNIGGRVLIWMSDRSAPPFRIKRLIESVSSFRVKRLIKPAKRFFKRGFSNAKKLNRLRKFKIYPNWTVLYIPDGAVDPFHSFNENPSKIIPLIKGQGFQLNDQSYNSTNEIFLCFTKINSEFGNQ